MSNITLFSSIDTGCTVINNTFIDEYLPRANGSYVKVYLLLLRCLQNNCENLSLSYLAEKLDETEKDIDRALKYWEKENLLTILRVDKSTIASITIQSITNAAKPNISQKEPEPVPIAQEEPLVKERSPITTVHKPNYSDSQIK